MSAPELRNGMSVNRRQALTWIEPDPYEKQRKMGIKISFQFIQIHLKVSSTQ